MNLLTIVFVLAMIVLALISIDDKRNFKNEIASLGMLGTFVGVFYGLYTFDVNALENSIPYLLDGLKFAFITSIFGLFFYICLSVFKKKVENSLAEIFIKNQEETNRILRDSLYNISNHSSQEIIKALEEVVKEFNQNLTTQFGENFKQLNEGVAQLLIWQENYKSNISQTEDSINKILNQIDSLLMNNQNIQNELEKILQQFGSTSGDVSLHLKKTIEVVEESFDLLIRNANASIR